MVKVAPDLPLTENCHHYTRLDDVPLHIRKYWKSRHKIFSIYNDGIYLTDDAWFGVTPEPIARRIAEDIPLPIMPESYYEATVHIHPPAPPPITVVDMFAGAGGNTIAFALWGFFDRIIGIEKDAETLACAQENARVSGVADGVITWVHGDCFEVLNELLQPGNDDDVESDSVAPLDPDNTVVFASPPWGGVSYTAQSIFDLSTMEPYNLQQLHDVCYPLPHALYLPRTSDLQQLADVVPRKKQGSTETETQGGAEAEPKLEVVQYCMEGFSKALVAYYPAEKEALKLLPRRTEK